MTELRIRPATPTDRPAVWAIIGPVFRAGDSYAIDPDISEHDALAYWLRPDQETFVAEAGGEILGTYYIRANQGGGGDHVCNCGYITSPAARGRGIARAMAAHSFAQARHRGFLGMQFNFVVATNLGAIHLWETLGFTTVGRLPQAFRHPTDGLVDALIMYRAV